MEAITASIMPAAFFHVDMSPAAPKRLFKSCFSFGETTHEKVGLRLKTFGNALAAFGAGSVHG